MGTLWQRPFPGKLGAVLISQMCVPQLLTGQIPRATNKSFFQIGSTLVWESADRETVSGSDVTVGPTRRRRGNLATTDPSLIA